MSIGDSGVLTSLTINGMMLICAFKPRSKLSYEIECIRVWHMNVEDSTVFLITSSLSKNEAFLYISSG